MIGHTGYEVWCDKCKIALSATLFTVHETKTEAWKAAKASGWTLVTAITKIGSSTTSKMHYCPKCSEKKSEQNGHGS